MNHMHKFMHNTFWVENQVSFTFDVRDNGDDPTSAINLSDFADFLSDQGFPLKPWGDQSPNQFTGTGLVAQLVARKYPGIYVFPSRVVCFFQFGGQHPDPQLAKGISQGNQHIYQSDTILSTNPVARLVNLVHKHRKTLVQGKAVLSDGTKLSGIADVTAAPVWYCGASNGNTYGQVTTGCPLTPPIPVAANAKCASSSGLWPIELPKLPHQLKEMTGDGVTVLVLDSLPKEKDIRRAALAAGEHNLLLLDLVDNVTFTYPTLPDFVDRAGWGQTKTGKDINGRAVGFRMPDHGLFIAGIIRDIAPNASVECIRVLNDYCAGTVQILIDQLYRILQRVRGGDLSGKDVVINMSLEIPDDEDVKSIDMDLNLTRQGLFEAIDSLSRAGVIFVASAGNEGDRRSMKSKGEQHPDPLYPAAYAYPLGGISEGIPNMIPVGAVNLNREASSYSCYPGLRGVATYGGEIPAEKAIVRNKETGMTEVDPHQIDAVVGVYTQLSYPALSFDDPEATYAAPNAHGWAYWIGTSFATPIISALVARSLELRQRTPPSGSAQPNTTEDILNNATQRKIPWQVISEGHPATVDGLMVWAQQCSPFHKPDPVSRKHKQMVS